MPIPGKNSITYPYGFSFVIKKESGSLRNSIENLITPYPSKKEPKMVPGFLSALEKKTR